MVEGSGQGGSDTSEEAEVSMSGDVFVSSSEKFRRVPFTKRLRHR